MSDFTIPCRSPLTRKHDENWDQDLWNHWRHKRKTDSDVIEYLISEFELVGDDDQELLQDFLGKCGSKHVRSMLYSMNRIYETPETHG